MQPYCVADIGGIRCGFDDLNSSGLTSIWEWKLDPYRDRAMGNAQIECELDLMVKKKLVDSTELPKWEKQAILYEKVSGFYKKRVYSAENGGTYWVFSKNRKKATLLAFYVNASWKEVTLLLDRTDSYGCIPFEYLNSVFYCVALQHQFLPFHAVLMEYNGHGIAIAAPSGTGKTTHSRLWREYKNAVILNGDCAACKRDTQGWKGYGIPWSGTSGEQMNRKVPLHAMVILERGKENEVQKLDKTSAFRKLIPHVHYPHWDRKIIGLAMEQMDIFLEEIPVFQLVCRPDRESVEILFGALFRHEHNHVVCPSGEY